jgi:hypothetical protein
VVKQIGLAPSLRTLVFRSGEKDGRFLGKISANTIPRVRVRVT